VRVHYFRHVPFEELGSVAAWLDARGFATTRTRFDEGDALPPLADIDWLVVMGGPMSVNDEKLHPWLATEKTFVREAIRAGKRVLGICLGAQLIASALGARVHPNAVKEIGWHPIAPIPGTGGDAAFRFPPDTLAFHWHGETFDLPAGAVQLARSAGCEHQAFGIGPHVLGLQFHLETTPESARALVENCRADLTPGPYVQSVEHLLSAPAQNYRAANALMERVLSHLAAA
jgi:GMP synthase-like glutamine amidotransferase